MQNRALLEQPFKPEQIRQREGRGGKTLDYLSGADVIQRMNDALEADWSFEVLSHQILEATDEVLVLGKLTVAGITKMDFGTDTIERYKSSGKPISLGDNYKSAATDCIKRCARLLGVGLELYKDDKPASPAAPPAVNSHGNGEGAHETETSPDIELPHLFEKVKALGLTETDLRAQMKARSMPARFRDLTARHLVTLYQHYSGVQASREPIALAEPDVPDFEPKALAEDPQQSAAAESAGGDEAVTEPAAADPQEEEKLTAWAILHQAEPVSDATAPLQKYASVSQILSLFNLAKHVGYRTLEADLKGFWETRVNDFIVPMPTYQEKLQHLQSLLRGKNGKVA